MIKGDFRLEKIQPSKGHTKHKQPEAVSKRNKGEEQ